MRPAYGHSGQRSDHGDWQLLRDHLVQVAALAARLGREACPGGTTLADAAHTAGLLHDLGKYRPEFQQKLHNVPVPRELTYHKQAGAAKAYDARNGPVAFAIAGHHGGMPDLAALTNLVAGGSGRRVASAVWQAAVADCAALAACNLSAVPGPRDRLAVELFTRLVFSCLVDADWADTSEHERAVHGWPVVPPPPALEVRAWLARTLEHVRTRAATCPEAQVAKVRDEVLRACLDAAELPAGLFTLTVPTGGGKTLSGLAFALKHAAMCDMRRVIYVAPYLSIIDQNARVFREALGLGPNAAELFEHHSLAEPPGDDDQEETRKEAAVRRAEAWDAPFIVTTNVQFFESLLSNRPGRCRKLHNIARSVVLLDECQSLPPELVAPTCSVLGQVVREMGCSVVLCTATQPAFDHPDMPERLDGAREIAPSGLDLFRRLRRVEVAWPERDSVSDWPTVAGQMRQERAALCVVNTKRAARDLFAELRKEGGDVFHLSTALCPAHRLMVLDEVRERLDKRRACYLVSTQLIEAGVDIDFPFVLRELAPLESVIQAAGRCNREGRLNAPDGRPGGRVVVFRSVEGAMPPDRWYRAGRSVLEASFLNAGRVPQLDDPAAIREYFGHFSLMPTAIDLGADASPCGLES